MDLSQEAVVGLGAGLLVLTWAGLLLPWVSFLRRFGPPSSGHLAVLRELERRRSLRAERLAPRWVPRLLKTPRAISLAALVGTALFASEALTSDPVGPWTWLPLVMAMPLLPLAWYPGRPLGVLVLGASGRPAASLLLEVAGLSAPFRTAWLTDPGALRQALDLTPDQRLPYALWDGLERVEGDADWQEGVAAAAMVARVVLVDARRVTDHVARELELMTQGPLPGFGAISPKVVVLVSGPLPHHAAEWTLVRDEPAALAALQRRLHPGRGVARG